VPLESARRYADLLPQARFTSVADADHAWSSRPWRRQLVDHLRAFLGR
jgi:hypothetical protein